MSKKAPLNLKIWQFLWSWHGLWYHLHHFFTREQNISIVGVFWASLVSINKSNTFSWNKQCNLEVRSLSLNQTESSKGSSNSKRKIAYIEPRLPFTNYLWFAVKLSARSMRALIHLAFFFHNSNSNSSSN